MNDSDFPKPKRRWYQFNMRTLLVVVLLFCVGIGWAGSRMYRARKNRERQAAALEKTVAKIEQLGGTHWTTFDRRRSQTRLEKLFQDPGGPDDPVAVRMLVAGFENAHITDADLKQLEGVTNIGWLALPNTDVTDSGLEQIGRLTDLFALELSNTGITDAGLEYLEALANLQVLSLNNTKITDAGLEHLRRSTHLRVLDFSGTSITDGGLDRLKRLTKLQTLWLKANPQLTDEGVKNLQQALPNCKIIR